MPPEQAPGITPTTDFNAAQIATTVSKHDADFIDVRARIDAIELKFNPEGVATFLEEAAQDSKKLDKLLSSLFCDMFKNDPHVQSAVADMMKKADRSFFFSALKRGGLLLLGFIYSVALIVIGAWIAHLFGGTPHTGG